MKISHFVALLAALFVASYLVAFLVKRGAAVPLQTAPATVAAAPEEESPAAAAAKFEKTADRVTMGSGIPPEPPTGPAASYDEVLRKMAALEDGEEKIRLAQEIGAVRDPAAVPVLLDWATSTIDRGVLRATLDALGPLGNATMIAEIRRRFDTAFRADDRYRLAKTIRNITNVEAVPALIDLANDATAPPQLSIAATEALATLGTPAAVSVLFEKLGTAPVDESGRLVTMIARIDQSAALPSLQYAAQGNKEASSPAARAAAIQALANFRSDETGELLRRLSNDPTDVVRAAARDVLARIR